MMNLFSLERFRSSFSFFFCFGVVFFKKVEFGWVWARKLFFFFLLGEFFFFVDESFSFSGILRKVPVIWVS